MQNNFIIANLAQSVEQRIRNAQVAGSIPAVGSKQDSPESCGSGEFL